MSEMNINTIKGWAALELGRIGDAFFGMGGRTKSGLPFLFAKFFYERATSLLSNREAR